MPDQQLGFVFGHWMTMGQVLTLPMVILGLYLIVSAKLRVGGGVLTLVTYSGGDCCKFMAFMES